MMGCDAEDSIEHYCTGPAIRSFGTARLGLGYLPPGDRLAGFMGMLWINPEDHTAELRSRALLTAAAYKLHCWHRHQHSTLSAQEMLQALAVKYTEEQEEEEAEEGEEEEIDYEEL